MLAVVHPTYAIFLWIPFAGFVGVRFLWERREGREGLRALGALVLPAVLFFLVLLPVIRSTASVSPDAAERARGLVQYAGQLNVHSPDSFSVSAKLFGRAGSVAVAALLLLPLGAFAARRRWAAFAVGGALAIFAVTLLPFVFTPFSDVVSLSQSRRLVGFLPFGIALAGGMGVLAARLGRATAPIALLAGILFQILYPGDFGYTLEHGGPAWVTWFAVVGCLAALGYGLLGLPPIGASAGIAAAMLLLPTYVHGFGHWTSSPARQASPLSDGLVSAIRHRSIPVTPSTPIPRRATGSVPPHRSTSASTPPGTSRTRRGTARGSVSVSSGASPAPATSGSHVRAARAGSSSTAVGST